MANLLPAHTYNNSITSYSDMEDQGPYLYQIWQRINGKRWLMGEPSDLDEAKANILNEPNFLGGELMVREINLRTGADECVFVAYYDEDLQRYLED